MNPVVARLTASSLLGRRRALVLLALPLVLVALSVVFRLTVGQDEPTAVGLLDRLALGTVVPLLCVVVGTGAIGPEIEDGSIVYLLSKPLSRLTILLTKLAVAVGTAWCFVVPGVLISGWVLAGTSSHLAIAYTVAAAVATVAYCAVFLLLAVLTRNAVIVGLLYALLWETTVAGVVPGARALSVRQWSLSFAESIVGGDATALGVDSAVGLVAAVVLLVLVTVGATWFAASRLRTLRLTSAE